MLKDKTKEIEKRLNPPIWQHDYNVLKGINATIQKFSKTYLKLKEEIIIDYGAGLSPYKELLSPFIKKYISIDIEKNSNVDIVVADNQKIPLPAGFASLVLSTQVLEHVNNFDFYLAECHRILKKGGFLFLSTHGIWPYHPYPADNFRFTKSGLENVIQKAGFEIRDNISLLKPYSTIVQFELLLLADYFSKQNTLFRHFFAFLSLIGNLYIVLLERLFQKAANNDAAVFIVCAEKK